MKKLLLVLVLIAAVIAGIKGFIYYKVTTQLDETIAALSPFARISYEGVSSDLSGAVMVEGVKISAYGGGISANVDEVVVQFPDLQSLVFAGDQFEKQQLPERMNLRLNHLRMDLQPLVPYMAMLQSASQQPFQDYSLLGCGDLPTAGPLKVFQALGYSELDATVSLGYEWERDAKRLVVNSGFRWHDMTTSDITINLDQVAALSAAAMMSSPELSRIAITVEDEGYNARLVEYCAGIQKVSGDDFIMLHMAMLRGALQEQGITLSENLFDAYRYYLKAVGPLKLQMYPGSIQQLSNAHMFKPSDLPALLGLEIHMGDKVIRDIGIDWDQAKLEQVIAEMEPAKKPAEPETRTSEPQTQAETTETGYVEISVAHLNKYINKSLRIKTRDQRYFEGALKQVGDNRFFIDVPMGSGSATLPINLADVERLEVKTQAQPYSVAPIDR